jgi:outer membrane protein assembly factor BamE (lipoprotein component of BamABCDE complex)
MFINNHILKNLAIFFLFIFISNCQLKEPIKSHGIMYLENRSKKLDVNISNKNDVIKIFGRPHIKDEESVETWIYFERLLSKGKFHKLGQHVLKENNVLVLNFNKYGVIAKKRFIGKDEMNKLKFSNMATENELSKKSFVEKFLNSIKAKMYGNR